MTDSNAVIERALAGASDPPSAARVLFKELFAHLGAPLAAPLWEMLSATAERATAVRMTTPPIAPGLPQAEALGDNWFQCPGCADVYEGNKSKCPGCEKLLAVASPALEIVLGDDRFWVRVHDHDGRRAWYLRSGIDSLRVESDGRSFELLDEAGRVAIGTALAAKLALPPNVAPIGLRGDGSVLVAHATKFEVHIVAEGALRADPQRSAEIVVHEIATVLYPDDVVPVAPTTEQIASRGHARNDKLEAAIAADPDHVESYLVYADWLQGQGDPRGELIVLQHGGKTLAASQWLDRHAPHFFGALADVRHMLESSGPLGRNTSWRLGFLDALWISQKYEDGAREMPVDEALAAMLDHPSCRMLRELTVGIVSNEGNTYEGIAKVIGERDLPHLRTLILGDFCSEETELNWSEMGDISPIYRAVPGLETLILRSGSMELGVIDLPKLAKLAIISGGFDPRSLASICEASWPVLDTLSIQLGDESAFRLAHLEPILAARACPKVKHLGLGNSNIADEICRGLVESKIAAQLESLDLSMSTLGDDGALALAGGSFPRLRSIDVSRCWLTDQGIEALSKIAREVHSDDQQDDDGDPGGRYIAGRE